MATRTDITDGWEIDTDMQVRIPVTDGIPVLPAYPDGTPVTMTGWSLGFAIRVKATGGQGDLVFSATAPQTITIEDGAGTDDVAVITVARDGYVSGAVLAEDEQYEYALWRYDAGAKQVLKKGQLHMEASARFS